DLALSDGAYRVRGPQLPFSWDFAVDTTGPVSRWTLSLPGDLSGTADHQAQSQRLRSGRQKLIVQNNHDQELVVRVERSASREDALTAARATALALFRELFPGEVLDSGQLVSITAITFLVIDLGGVGRLERGGNLYATIGEARTFAFLRDY